ncbi:3-deoxy-8-phosphooctulonate synthase [Mesoterricola silvestris]|uniref:2-dehydro-3-deoxyphosphooctonate aldolase n=1 Tax=Mesoterricola silvestris TaxID=2927979 RepID=A0AA48GH81_9BACT|nr:3-deoxy-8-phosphooctulonate synthase [Mesoterricola silvestris]BDU70899.1 2-dehydro-3-deoxyphosphooctonate aldolase [Mesoterricola silvestris]
MDFSHPHTDRSFFLIAGPCVIESRDHAHFLASQLRDLAESRGIPFLFKASFDKANRTSLDSYRGTSMEEGLDILSEIRTRHGVPVLTDVHESAQCPTVAAAVDVLQIPAFLCRQTDLLLAAGATGRAVNIKKGQFLAPWDLSHAVEKVRGVAGHGPVWATERGSSFGYGNLVVDFQGFPHLRRTGCPVVFDATHSVQKPGALGKTTGGAREMIPSLARAAATAVDGFFFEVHEDPAKALSDGPNAIRLEEFGALLDQLLEVWRASRAAALADPAGRN